LFRELNFHGGIYSLFYPAGERGVLFGTILSRQPSQAPDPGSKQVNKDSAWAGFPEQHTNTVDTRNTAGKEEGAEEVQVAQRERVSS